MEIFCKTLRGKTYLLIQSNLLDAIVGSFLLVLARSAFFFSDVSKTYFRGLESMFCVVSVEVFDISNSAIAPSFTSPIAIPDIFFYADVAKFSRTLCFNMLF